MLSGDPSRGRRFLCKANLCSFLVERFCTLGDLEFGSWTKKELATAPNTNF